MIFIPIQLQAPFLVVLLGIFLCLIFETAGVPEGFRRQGSKGYLTLISGFIIASVFFLLQQSETSSQPEDGFAFDSLAKNSMLSVSTLALLSLCLIANREKKRDGGRGEVYSLLLLSYFFCLIICSAHDLLILGVVVCGWPILQIGMLAQGNAKTVTSEAALKLVMLAAFAILLFSFVLIFLDFNNSPNFLLRENFVATTIAFLFLLLLLGTPPLQSFRIDILDGSPIFSAAFFSASTLIVCSVVLTRLLNRLDPLDPLINSTYSVLIIFAGISLCVGAMFALDQTKISRLCTYLISSQAGLVLFVCALSLDRTVSLPKYFYGLLFTHFALCAIGIYSAIDYWRNSERKFNTWEDFSGAGRENPLVAGAFLIVLASICGLPFTSGFSLRFALIELTPEGFRVPVIFIVFLSIIFSAVPVLRLMAFLFGKSQRYERETTHSQMNVFLLLGCAILLALSSLTPESFLLFVFG